MSRLTIHTVESSPQNAQPRIAAVLQNNGFIPNLIGVLANAPAALEMYQEVGKINARTSLTPAEIEVIQITTAKANACAFCVAGHTKIATLKALFTPEVLSALRHLEDFDAQNPKLNALARFTLEVIHNQGAVSDAELQHFFAQGYGEQQALEVILGVALATLCNYTNNLAKIEINTQLQAFA
ncbi:carboxymuconolactone decarboxylase family protein [Wohlfahrtiimonas sp. G9077]|uniref:carboxymuconolactone decarboxylase family protein n=1 Tax=Wohlfahrtiimonas sp. G9077 TaxID=1980118 RepID=UPI000B991DA7|nr:carboxymuconolactone decarboxylase family protein [Wohlfahrtiimonas sp. G9077]OYQ75649.1 alkylhydroperoxidase [Wohlfahrtiimonas sp. G9077]